MKRFVCTTAFNGFIQIASATIPFTDTAQQQTQLVSAVPFVFAASSLAQQSELEDIQQQIKDRQASIKRQLAQLESLENELKKILVIMDMVLSIRI